MFDWCQVSFDGGERLNLRPNSWDYGIACSVFLDNEYRLPERFSPDDVILDIGAHIGAFSYACLKRGIGKVIAFEPEVENFALALANLSPFGDRCDLHAKAVWRSDVQLQQLDLSMASNRMNTGGHAVTSDHGEGGYVVSCIGLDEVLSGINRPIRLLKIDCEGAEYPILLTARHLHTVEEIVGEFHLFGSCSEHGLMSNAMRVAGVDQYDATTLSKYLDALGFDVNFVKPAVCKVDHGLFFARRRRAS